MSGRRRPPSRGEGPAPRAKTRLPGLRPSSRGEDPPPGAQAHSAASRGFSWNDGSLACRPRRKNTCVCSALADFCLGSVPSATGKAVCATRTQRGERWTLQAGNGLYGSAAAPATPAPAGTRRRGPETSRVPLKSCAFP